MLVRSVAECEDEGYEAWDLKTQNLEPAGHVLDRSWKGLGVGEPPDSEPVTPATYDGGENVHVDDFQGVGGAPTFTTRQPRRRCARRSARRTWPR